MELGTPPRPRREHGCCQLLHGGGPHSGPPHSNCPAASHSPLTPPPVLWRPSPPRRWRAGRWARSRCPRTPQTLPPPPATCQHRPGFGGLVLGISGREVTPHSGRACGAAGRGAQLPFLRAQRRTACAGGHSLSMPSLLAAVTVELLGASVEGGIGALTEAGHPTTSKPRRVRRAPPVRLPHRHARPPWCPRPCDPPPSSAAAPAARGAPGAAGQRRGGSARVGPGRLRFAQTMQSRATHAAAFPRDRAYPNLQVGVGSLHSELGAQELGQHQHFRLAQVPWGRLEGRHGTVIPLQCCKCSFQRRCGPDSDRSRGAPQVDQFPAAQVMAESNTRSQNVIGGSPPGAFAHRLQLASSCAAAAVPGVWTSARPPAATTFTSQEPALTSKSLTDRILVVALLPMVRAACFDRACRQRNSLRIAAHRRPSNGSFFFERARARPSDNEGPPSRSPQCGGTRRRAPASPQTAWPAAATRRAPPRPSRRRVPGRPRSRWPGLWRLDGDRL